MKRLKNLLGKSFKVVVFILATILWSIFVYIIDGEWLYFAPLIAGDVLFWETISWQFWRLPAVPIGNSGGFLAVCATLPWSQQTPP